MPQLLYPFLSQCTSRLLLCLAYCKHCCNEFWGTCAFLNYGFLRVYAQQQYFQHTWQFCQDFPDGSAAKGSACEEGSTGDGSSPGSESFSGGANGNPLQYTCHFHLPLYHSADPHLHMYQKRVSLSIKYHSYHLTCLPFIF